MVQMQRTADHRVPRPSGYIYNTNSTPKAQRKTSEEWADTSSELEDLEASEKFLEMRGKGHT